MLIVTPEHITSILEIWSLIPDHGVMSWRNEPKVATSPMPIVCSNYIDCRCDWILPRSLSNAGAV